MKIKHLLILVAASIVALASCKPEDPQKKPIKPITPDSLVADPMSLQFEYDDTTSREVTVTCDERLSWCLEPEAEWITAQKISENKFTVKVGKNPETRDRPGTVGVRAGGFRVNVTVIQKGRKLFLYT